VTRCHSSHCHYLFATLQQLHVPQARALLRVCEEALVDLPSVVEILLQPVELQLFEVEREVERE
jgi:hypothetical protein